MPHHPADPTRQHLAEGLRHIAAALQSFAAVLHPERPVEAFAPPPPPPTFEDLLQQAQQRRAAEALERRAGFVPAPHGGVAGTTPDSPFGPHSTTTVQQDGPHNRNVRHPGSPMGGPQDVEDLYPPPPEGRGGVSDAPSVPEDPPELDVFHPEHRAALDAAIARSGCMIPDAMLPPLPPPPPPPITDEEALTRAPFSRMASRAREAAAAAAVHAAQAYAGVEEWDRQHADPKRVGVLQQNPEVWFNVLVYYLIKALEAKTEAAYELTMRSIELLPGAPNHAGREWRARRDVNCPLVQQQWDTAHRLLQEGRKTGRFDIVDETLILQKLGSPMDALMDPVAAGLVPAPEAEGPPAVDPFDASAVAPPDAPVSAPPPTLQA